MADPRHTGVPKFNNIYRVVPWSAAGPTVTGGKDMAVADPRTAERRGGVLSVAGWQHASGTVAGESLPGDDAFAVADPRPNLDRAKGDAWHGGGQFGVMRWDGTSGAVPAAAGCDNGAWSVGDPRLPEQTDRLVAVIRALDGTSHRPISTLELEGLSDAAWRERIGNAVPPDAAQAMAETMGRTLLIAWSGAGFMLSSLPIWVRPVAVALSVRQPDEAPGGPRSRLPAWC